MGSGASVSDTLKNHSADDIATIAANRNLGSEYREITKLFRKAKIDGNYLSTQFDKDNTLKLLDGPFLEKIWHNQKNSVKDGKPQYNSIEDLRLEIL